MTYFDNLKKSGLRRIDRAKADVEKHFQACDAVFEDLPAWKIAMRRLERAEDRLRNAVETLEKDMKAHFQLTLRN